jgi:hypothetical protein
MPVCPLPSIGLCIEPLIGTKYESRRPTPLRLISKLKKLFFLENYAIVFSKFPNNSEVGINREL